MKALIPLLLLSVSLVSGASAQAAAVLKIPLFVGHLDHPTPMAEYNLKFKAAGLAQFPEYAEISSGQDAYKTWLALSESFEKQAAIIGVDVDEAGLTMEYYPGTQDTASLATCYRGPVDEVVAIAQGLTDVHYSDQMQVRGWKYKNTMKLASDLDPDDQEILDFLNDNSDRWKNWQGKNEDLLILTSIGDGGDDIEEALIPLCK